MWLSTTRSSPKKLGVDYIETVRGVGYRVPKEHP